MWAKCQTCSRFSIFVALVCIGLSTASLHGAEAELCLNVEEGCEIPGSYIRMSVRTRSDGIAIVGAQFSVAYDPQALQFVQISPGAACDQASPYSFEIFRDVNQSSGTIFYGSGIQLGAAIEPTEGWVALACVTFLARRIGESNVCISHDDHPRWTRLVDETGQGVDLLIPESCANGAMPPALACAEVAVTDNCTCTPEADECESLDTECRTGVCDEAVGLCTIEPANEGGPCDDENPCTTNDACQEGRCVGTDCSNPSVCLVRDNCPQPGGLARMAVRLGEGEPLISGGQFSFEYDPAGLELVSIAPGSACSPDSPFSTEVSRMVDSVNGIVFYAVGIGLDEQPTTGPAVIACITFRLLDLNRSETCMFEGVNPFHLRLVNHAGQGVGFFNAVDCPTERPFPYTSCIHYDFCEIPTTSTWGLVVLALLLAVLGKVHFGMEWSRNSKPTQD